MTTSTLLGLKMLHLPVRRIGVEEPTRWLYAAWRDFAAAPGTSLAHGAVFVLLGYVLLLGLHRLGLGSLIPAAVACFFLLAPLLAVGLYEVCRQRERGESPSFESTIFAFRRNLPGLAGIGLVLMLSVGAWMQLAFLIFMLFFNASPPGLDNFVYNVLMSDNALPFLCAGTLVGMVIATIVFTISAVSIPLLLDRDVSALTAMSTSCAVVRENWRVMIGWAFLIVLLIGSGIVTFLAGLAITLPLVAYATWHAYRATVGQE